MIPSIRQRLGLVGLVLACILVAGLETPGCRYWAGPLPLGMDNDVRVARKEGSRQWAEPMDRPGLPNLHKVSDDLYRGAQPTAEGFKELEAMGIKTIINLRLSGAAQQEVRGTGMTAVRIPATAWQPQTEDVVQFLRIVTDETRVPVYVHCQRGADRTGLMCAVYRVAVQGWSKDQAIAEMTQGGFGFYSGWHNLVRYVRDLDVERIMQQVAAGTDSIAHQDRECLRSGEAPHAGKASPR